MRVVDGSTHSQEDGVETDCGCSLLKVLTELAVLLLCGLKLASRSGVFTVFNFHKVNVSLVWSELTGLSHSGC